MAISNSASPEIKWGIGGPDEDHQLHHCCWTGRVGEREEEEEEEEEERTSPLDMHAFQNIYEGNSHSPIPSLFRTSESRPF